MDSLYSHRPTLPPTPPHDDVFLPPCAVSTKQKGPPALATGLKLLEAERDGLAHLHQQYSESPVAQEGFASAVEVLISTTQRHGCVVVSGVGKSGLIGRKMIATMNSLGIRAAWMHPTEALHGDLGMIGPNDALILITFSGSTVELLSLVDHLPSSCPLILMTSGVPSDGQVVAELPLFAARVNAAHKNNILLPTPIPVAEKTLFGVSAPTVSTTVTLALGDALAMAAANQLHEHQDGVSGVFKKYHPGGAIGKANAHEGKPKSLPPTPSDEPPGSASPMSLAGSTIGDMTDSEADLSLDAASTSGSTDVADERAGEVAVKDLNAREEPQRPIDLVI